MVSNKEILQKCKDLGIKCSTRSNISVLKEKLLNNGVDPETLKNIRKSTEDVTKNGEVSEVIIPQIVEEVMKRITQPQKPSKTKNTKDRGGKKSNKKRKRTRREISPRREESDEDQTSSSSSLSSSSSDEEPEPVKRKGKRIGKKTLSLTFSVAPAVKTKVLQGKYVPLYKLLPGFETMGQDSACVMSENGLIRLNIGDGNRERRLSKQTLDLPQMVLALMKFKELVSDDFPERVIEIDTYIANIALVACKYGGLSYWYYHAYFWDKAAEASDRGEKLNWHALDAEALHAAVAGSPPNYCDNCQSWTHHSTQCPFSLRQESQPEYGMPRNGAGKSPSISSCITKDRVRAFYKGKEICNQFNYSVCSKSRNPPCEFLHMCRFCNSYDHSIRKCHNIN